MNQIQLRFELFETLNNALDLYHSKPQIITLLRLIETVTEAKEIFPDPEKRWEFYVKIIEEVYDQELT